MKALIATFVALLVAAPALLAPAPAAAPPEECGTTTLDATIRIGKDGTLQCAPGQRIVVRDELAKPKPTRVKTRVPLTAFFTIADVQLADEESPARGEWADKCGQHPASAAFRPQETMVPHLFNAHVTAANQIAAKGSPVLGVPMELALTLGDLADNQQYNEIRAVIDILDGRKLVDPDTGADGYDGVQGTDPRGANNEILESPIEGESILDLANEPFWATGLRRGTKPIPWYSLPGNHDVKVQGTVPDDVEPWRVFIREYVKGSVKVTDIAPDHQQQLCNDPSLFGDPEFMQKVLTNPQTTKIVPPDEDRRFVDRDEWMAEHKNTTGLPVGHGFFPKKKGDARCTDADGNELARACYAFGHERFRFIGVDTSPEGGRETGNIDGPQFRWLERELIANSSRYFDADGKRVSNAKATDRLIVVFTHHTISSTNNRGTVPRSDEHYGEDLRQLLLRFPNVIMQASGHTHMNKIWAHQNEDLGTGYWEVNNSAIVDAPHQSRTIEITDNKDGTLSIFGVVFDAAVPPDHRDIDFHGHDHTSEVALGGAKRNMNEDWFASAAREVGFYDPQTDLTAIGEPEDRNVELLVKAPAWFSGASSGGGNSGGGGDTAGGRSGGGSEGSSGGGSPGGSGSSGGEVAGAPATEVAGSSLAATGAALLPYLVAGLCLIVAGFAIRRKSSR